MGWRRVCWIMTQPSSGPTRRMFALSQTPTSCSTSMCWVRSVFRPRRANVLAVDDGVTSEGDGVTAEPSSVLKAGSVLVVPGQLAAGLDMTARATSYAGTRLLGIPRLAGLVALTFLARSRVQRKGGKQACRGHAPMFDAVRGHLATVGPVHADVVAVGIFLKNPRKFAELRPMQRWVAVSFSLSRRARHRTITRRIIEYGTKFWHVANVARPEDLDDELRDLLTEVYHLAG